MEVYSPPPLLLRQPLGLGLIEDESLRERMAEMQQILGHSLNDPRLLVEALTHPSHVCRPTYERLEHVGDAALNLVFTNYLYYNNPGLNPGRLSVLRSANISTEKLARVAARHGFYNYLRRVSPVQDQMVEDFTKSVMEEDATDIACAAFGGANVKAPKILSDLVESIAGAVYVDSNYDGKVLWKVFEPLMRPIIKSENLQPITKVYELCQKMGKNIELVDSIDVDRGGNKTHVVKAVVDGVVISETKSDQKTIAKLNAARQALQRMQKRNTRKAPKLNVGREALSDLQKRKAPDTGGSEQKSTTKLNPVKVSLGITVPKAPTSTEYSGGSEQKSNTKINPIKESLGITVPKAPDTGGSEQKSTTKLKSLGIMVPKAHTSTEYSGGSEQNRLNAGRGSEQNRLNAGREVLSDMEKQNTLHQAPVTTEYCRGSDESDLSITCKEAISGGPQDEEIKKRRTAELLSKRVIYDVCPAAATRDRVGAKQELHRMCGKNHWEFPVYKLHREEGPAHDKRFVASVLVQTPDTDYIMLSGFNQKLKEAENQAAFGLLLKFQNMQT